MSAPHHGPAKPQARSNKPPAMPLTLDGSPVLHQMFRLRWPALKALSPQSRAELISEAVEALEPLESHAEGGSAVFAELGHKGDLMLVHFRRSFEALNAAELAIAQLGLYEYLEPTTSYVSTVELGLYAGSVQIYKELLEAGVQPGSPEWVSAEQDKLAEQRQAMEPRLFPTIPPNRYVCFYPMDKKRTDGNNWYAIDINERARMMREHGMIGRRYAGKVKQIISASIGFDDWEWGVDLFADDALVFKQLIYEMRFDEASALYAAFGKFYIGIRFPVSELRQYLEGRPPAYGIAATA